MKATSLCLLLAGTFALVLNGCKSSDACCGKAQTACATKTETAAVPAAKAPAAPLAAAPKSDIPDRPEKLSFPALQYEAPRPSDYRTVLKSGPVAYIVPDRELPLINISVLVRTGEYLEPEGKEGVAELAGYLLARGGTKSKTAEALEERLAFLAASLSSSVSDTQGGVSLNLLAKDLDEGLAILREVLTAPRFQDDKIQLAKDQTLQGIKQRNDDSADIENRERAMLAFGEKFWVNRHSTTASVTALTKADFEEFHQKWFHPANFIVAVNGDFDRAAMTAKLETLFADWPFKGQTPPPVPTNTAFAKPGVYIVDKEVNQGRVAMMLPGISRQDPDYFPALIMNDILGGGGFTSHIMNRVRTDEGLAYSAGSSLRGGVYYPLTFTAAFQSKSRTVLYAVSIVREELQKMAAAAPTEEELMVSKRSFIDRFPRQFATKSQVAAIFADEEFTGRYAQDPDFWKKYRGRIEAITAADVLKAAQRFLTPDQLAILIVGQKEEVLKGHPNHAVDLKTLTSGPLVDVPLRDPQTMLPVKK